MVVDTIKRFHQVIGHPNEKRLRETLNQCYHHSKFCYHINRLKCKDCQKYKLTGHGYGRLPKQEVWIAPWEEVTIKLIGPWKVKVNCQQVQFNALTSIGMASKLAELICVDNKQPNIYLISLLKVGCVDILILYNVYMTRELNSLDITFNGYWKSSASRMLAQPAKIPNLMQSVKGCIRP
jgi:hypothetical protein